MIKTVGTFFCAKAFAQQGCPSELEEVGRKIVKKCKGLPLAIVVIGGLLRESPKSQEYWEKIAKEKHLVLDSVEGYKPLNILYLSYTYLPLCLKLCVLYLGICADYGLEMTELIKLWVAEGFIKQNKTRSLEEVAEGYIDDLVHRSLLFRTPLIVYRKMVKYSIHDLVRDLCMRISEKESLLCVERDQNGKRHVAVDKRSAMLYTRETVSHHRPIISRERWAAGRLRVLVRDIRRIDYTYPEVNSRLLYHEADKDDEYSDINPHDYWSVTYELSSPISLLWSLQTIIVTEISDVVAPSEIWEMPQLRHIDISSVSIPSPAPSSDAVVLHYLQTLRDVEDLVFTEDVCKRIPNVKELEISHYFHERGEASSRYHLHDVGRFDKLEKLVYSCNSLEFLEGSSRNLRLPSSLRELQLNDCKLDSCDVKILADSYTFPVLERLSLQSLSNFEEIPSAIGEIPTLKRISMYDCRESACISAVNILEEKEESFEHFGLRVEIKFSKESDAEMLGEKVEFGSKNLLISGFR
ncbi:putative late blight resistance protein homolog R1A-10 [Salvia hispanica]|uniref:putative late blight resistance protein homolog R1A-10 n=1 Tax=Salvia hispanica TaxID=49212 RepID=UPI0020092734|nr:putative late blight resistance protein homolog R1A-10 [Salvia hispanica]